MKKLTIEESLNILAHKAILDAYLLSFEIMKDKHDLHSFFEKMPENDIDIIERFAYIKDYIIGNKGDELDMKFEK